MEKCSLYLLLYLCVFIIDVKCHENLLVDVLRTDFLKLEDELWNFTFHQENKEDGSNPLIYIIKKFQEFDDKQMLKLPVELLYGLDVPRRTFPFLMLYADLRIIDDMYEKFRRYRKKYVQENHDDVNGYVLEIMTNSMVVDILQDEKNSVNKTIRRIYEQISAYDIKTVLGEVIQISEDDYICKGNDQSPQQVFYNFYNSIAAIDLKGYIMVQFALLALRLEEPGNYTNISVEANEQYRRRVRDLMLTFQEQMQAQHRKLWKCDPKYHESGKTYEQLTRLLQAHIQNEVDLNPSGTCRKRCTDYPDTRSYGCYDRNSQYCHKRKSCDGRLLECQSLWDDVTACIASPSSNRRYEYLEYSGEVFGEKRACSDRKARGWRRWFVLCTYCKCICDEEGPKSDRYFNLRPVMADIANNRVITGVRFVKHNRIIHLQIQEGELLPYGYINSSTVRWVPVDDYKITDYSTVKEGRDYYTMKFEKRSMNMDDLASHESDHIITGVSFVKMGSQLQLQINVRRFDFTNGTLSEDNHYIFGDSNHSFRTKINMGYPDIPTKTPKTIPNFETEQYVEFTHTSFKKDAAQTTVPFIDIQPVFSNPAVPLKGLGIYYKGKSGYGGFIAPVITTYDFGKYMNVNLPKSFSRIDKKDEVMIN